MSRTGRSSLQLAVAIVSVGTFATAMHFQTVLEDEALATAFMSKATWRALLLRIGVERNGLLQPDFATIAAGSFCVAVAAWLGGAALLAWRTRSTYYRMLTEWGRQGWLWTAVPVVWSCLYLVFGAAKNGSALLVLATTLPMWHAVASAGWLTSGVALWNCWKLSAPAPIRQDFVQSRRIPLGVWTAMGIYVVVFLTMNVLLWNALQVPHGDTAMYEEHLWNLLHGKGFRSYLDGGRLFLGEHIQVIHVLFVPLYLIWPHHLLLESIQSIALAAGAVPVFWIAQRHTRSRTAAACAAMAYLLYAPMQFLDIAVDLKTFRPNSFEIPLLLFGLDALERRCVGWFLFWSVLTLSCQEDAAMVLAPLGVWIAYDSLRCDSVAETPTSRMRKVALGVGLAAFGTLYVMAVIKFILPAFRGGGDVHFASYFSELGGSSGEIVRNLFLHPRLFIDKVATAKNLLFGLWLIFPLGLLPFLSPGRLAVAVPLFGVLCLSNITNTDWHHFHAPLVPILFWAAAAGLGRVTTLWNAWAIRRAAWFRESRKRMRKAQAFRAVPDERLLPSSVTRTERARVPAPLGIAGCWLVAMAFGLGALRGMSPLGTRFWEPRSYAYFGQYVSDRRAEQFPAAFALVPLSARVASTDFVHPRFTHHARSYDYSGYRPNLPRDAEYVVIDTQHKYSTIKRPSDVKEYNDKEWTVLMQGEFIVLKRNNSAQ